MTREKAIDRIKGWKETNQDFIDHPYVNQSTRYTEKMLNYFRQNGEIYDMCIEALSQPEQKKGNWRPLKTRPMDEDEREEWSEKLGYKLEDYEAVIYTSLPDEGQDVLICLQNGVVTIDALEQDDCGCYFVEYGDIEGVVAWMPLPEPYHPDTNVGNINPREGDIE